MNERDQEELEVIIETGVATVSTVALPALVVLAGHSFDMGWNGLGIGSVIAALWTLGIFWACGKASQERNRR